MDEPPGAARSGRTDSPRALRSRVSRTPGPARSLRGVVNRTPGPPGPRPGAGISHGSSILPSRARTTLPRCGQPADYGLDQVCLPSDEEQLPNVSPTRARSAVLDAACVEAGDPARSAPQ